MQSEFTTTLYVIALTGGQRIAIEADQVAAVVDLSEIVSVPLSPPHVLGLCGLRSQIVTVVDLACALGQIPEIKSRRAITMEIDNHHYAFVVSRVEGVEPNIEETQPADASIGAGWAAAVSGIVRTESGLALLLNPARLMAIAPEMTY